MSGLILPEFVLGRASRAAQRQGILALDLDELPRSSCRRAICKERRQSVRFRGVSPLCWCASPLPTASAVAVRLPSTAAGMAPPPPELTEDADIEGADGDLAYCCRAAALTRTGEPAKRESEPVSLAGEPATRAGEPESNSAGELATRAGEPAGGTRTGPGEFIQTCLGTALAEPRGLPGAVSCLSKSSSPARAGVNIVEAPSHGRIGDAQSKASAACMPVYRGGEGDANNDRGCNAGAELGLLLWGMPGRGDGVSRKSPEAP